MTQLELVDLGKRYGRRWLFRRVNKTVSIGEAIAITGANGSGKSTLLRTIAGYGRPTEGRVEWSDEGRNLERDDVYRRVSLAAPYIELIESFTLREMLTFHFRLHALDRAIADRPLDVAKLTWLDDQLDRPLRQFSSGMMQRLRLGMAFAADCPLLLLDEPCSNLDRAGRDWYARELARVTRNRLIFIASNDPEEYGSAGSELSLADFV